MKLSHQKLKMMYLAKILMEQTDEEHTITVPEMIAELSKLGISAERKSIYDDLEYLQLFGLDICSNKTRTTNYYIASRDFELPELNKFQQRVLEIIENNEPYEVLYNTLKNKKI